MSKKIDKKLKKLQKLKTDKDVIFSISNKDSIWTSMVHVDGVRMYQGSFSKLKGALLSTLRSVINETEENKK